MTEDAGTTPGRAIIVLASLVVVIAGIKAAAAIVVPFLCAAFLAILSLPALEGLKRRGVPGGLALAIVLLVIVFSASVIMVVIGSSLTGFQSNLPSYTEQFERIVGDAKTWMADHGVEISDKTDDAFDPKAILGFVGRVLTQIGGVMSNAFVILLILAFLLAEEVNMMGRPTSASDCVMVLASIRPAASGSPWPAARSSRSSR